MTSLPPPPIPRGLQELLKDYPEHLQILQDDLMRVVSNSLYATPAFERAIWALEDALGAFIQEARAELRAAEITGDASAAQVTNDKLMLMLRARSKSRWLGDEAFSGYFRTLEAGSP